MRLEVAVVGYNTDFFLHNLLVSLRDRLPAGSLEAVHVWDNGSTDRSLELLARFAGEAPWLRVHASPVNLQHGPALDRLLRHHCREDWVLVLDADTRILHDFRAALPPLEGGALAFVGQVHPQVNRLYAYLCHLLVNRRLYLELPPFRDHGAPGIDYFRGVEEQGLPWARFRWCDHVRHYGQGAVRGLLERGETEHELFAFALRETALDPKSPTRVAEEAAMRGRLGSYLDDAPGPSTPHRDVGEAPARPSRAAPGPRLGVLAALPAPAAWLLRRARRVGLVQHPHEIRRLLAVVRKLQPRRVLEIGTAYGGTFYLWTRAAARDAILVSVDLPPWELDDPGEGERVRQLRGFARPRQRVELVRASSHDARARGAAAAGLGGPADFLFIDGDHSYEGVRQDFLDYAPLVGAGGLVALHDIHPHSKAWGGEVPRFWKELRGTYRTEEIVADPAQDGFGIGLVRL